MRESREPVVMSQSEKQLHMLQCLVSLATRADVSSLFRSPHALSPASVLQSQAQEELGLASAELVQEHPQPSVLGVQRVSAEAE